LRVQLGSRKTQQAPNPMVERCPSRRPDARRASVLPGVGDRNDIAAPAARVAGPRIEPECPDDVTVERSRETLPWPSDGVAALTRRGFLMLNAALVG
jgi:hypothetical protein